MIGRYRIFVGWLVCLLWGFLPSFVMADDFDGTRMLTCTVDNGRQYHTSGQTRPFDPQSVGLPRVFILDFNEKIIIPGKESVIRRQSQIKRVKHIENMMILQGADDGMAGVDDGVGWSLAIEKSQGRFVVSAAGDNVGYIVFGSCKPMP